MIRRASMTDVDGASGDVYLYEFYGNSSDDKPTKNVSTGSIFIESDTSDVYMFDESEGAWIKMSNNSGGNNNSSSSSGGKVVVEAIMANNSITIQESSESLYELYQTSSVAIHFINVENELTMDVGMDIIGVNKINDSYTFFIATDMGGAVAGLNFVGSGTDYPSISLGSSGDPSGPLA